MTDYSELVARLREQADDVLDPGYPFYGTPELVREAADALEAHGRKISELIGMREEVLHYQREFHRMRDKLAEAEKDLATTQQCFEERGEVLGQYIHRLTEAEALLREAGTTIERLVDAVEEYGGRDDDGRASYATLPIRDRIDAFLTPPPAPGSTPEAP